jgi:CarboxypepD_reg-like domain
MIKYFHTFILICFSSFLFAQNRYVISGNILDDKSKTAIPFVNVFLEGTTVGTQTDINGNYTLNKVPVGKYKLVASMVGYLPYIQNLTYETKNLDLKIVLKEDVKYLAEVKVTAGKDKAWENNMKLFEKEFLGSDFNKKYVKILNREIVDFTNENNKLIAKASQPLVIENKLLGYKYTYILQNFEKDNERLAYKGLGRFELLDTTDAKLTAKYEKNRSLAFYGSVKHFIKAFLNGNLIEQGYNLYYVNPENQNFREPIFPKNSVFRTETNGQYLIILDCPLIVNYDKTFPYQSSGLKQLGNIIVTADGDLIDPYSIQINGSMANLRIAKTLPFDYELPGNQQYKNNFTDISNLPEVLKSSVKYSREKVEITSIEPYYLAGENIEFEAQVKDLSARTPSEISKTLYVDFIDLQKGKLIQNYILRLEKGFTNFKIPIENLTATGNYQIRAYTNWMRNFSENSFFKQNFTIFSQKYRAELSELPTAIYDTTNLFVEGQNLVEGLRSKLAINTFDNFGQKISSPFKLLSDKNDILIAGETDSTGLAIIEINPKADENYHVSVKDKKYFLPKPAKKGTVLTIDNLSSSEKLKVFIQNKGLDNEQDTLTLAIVRDGEILAWQSFLNNKPALILNIQKENLIGPSEVYLVDKKRNIIAQRHILVEENVEFEDIVKNDRELISVKPNDFFWINEKLPFIDEKGISIKGQIKRMNGKPNKNPVKLSLILSSLPTDSTKTPKQTHTYEVLNNFEFADLEFYGKKQATFIAPENRVIVDTTNSIPAIYPERLPINWPLIMNKKADADMERRKDELFEASLKGTKRETMLEEIKVFGNKLAKYQVDNITPNYVIEENQIINKPNMKDVIAFLKMSRKRFSKIMVFLDSYNLSPDDNIDDMIWPAAVENIKIFEYTIPATYTLGGAAECVIVINSRRGASGGSYKRNETVIVRGYDN